MYLREAYGMSFGSPNRRVSDEDEEDDFDGYGDSSAYAGSASFGPTGHYGWQPLGKTNIYGGTPEGYGSRYRRY